MRVEVGRPAEAIATLAAESQSGLIVMPVKAEGGPLEARPGSIAYRVLCLAQVPVLGVLPGVPAASGVSRAQSAPISFNSPSSRSRTFGIAAFSSSLSSSDHEVMSLG